MYDYEDALREMLYQVYRNTDDFEMRISKDCYKLIIEALEKQIPKKPTPHIVKVERLKIGNARWGKGTTVYKCPCCNNFISRLYDYCFKCGQAIDWSDEI